MQAEIQLFRPKTLQETLTLLAESAPNGMPLAGGTNVVVELRDGHHNGKTLIDLSCVAETKGISKQEGFITIGGGTTITELLHHDLITSYAPILCEAAKVFANPLVRNRATVAGNLVDASPAADTAPPLLALAAEVQLVSQNSSRWVALEDFILGVRKTQRRPEELLLAVRWPVPAHAHAGVYYKVGLRKADAISVLSAAVMLEAENGVITAARIALGAVAPRPIRVHEAEALLTGRPLADLPVEEAARLAAAAASPITDIRGSAEYRKTVTRVVAGRLINNAAQTLREES